MTLDRAEVFCSSRENMTITTLSSDAIEISVGDGYQGPTELNQAELKQLILTLQLFLPEEDND